MQILARIIGGDAEPSLRARLEIEKVRPVAQALREALLTLRATDADATGQRADDETGYWSVDGAWIAVPPFTLPPETPFPDEFVAALRPAVIEADRLQRELRPEWAKANDARLDPAGLELLASAADGKAMPGTAEGALKTARTLLVTNSSSYSVANRVFDAVMSAFLRPRARASEPTRAAPRDIPWGAQRRASGLHGLPGGHWLPPAREVGQGRVGAGAAFRRQADLLGRHAAAEPTDAAP